MARTVLAAKREAREREERYKNIVVIMQRVGLLVGIVLQAHWPAPSEIVLHVDSTNIPPR